MTADEFNAQVPVGAEVILTDDIGHEHRTRTRSQAWALSSGDGVVLVEGRSGGYLVDRLRPVTDDDTTEGVHALAIARALRPDLRWKGDSRRAITDRAQGLRIGIYRRDTGRWIPLFGFPGLDMAQYPSDGYAGPQEAMRAAESQAEALANAAALLATGRADGLSAAAARSQSWSAVYGATVAAQVAERRSLGQGPPYTDEDWEEIVEEARAVADMAAQAAGRMKERG